MQHEVRAARAMLCHLSISLAHRAICMRAPVQVLCVFPQPAALQALGIIQPCDLHLSRYTQPAELRAGRQAAGWHRRAGEAGRSNIRGLGKWAKKVTDEGWGKKAEVLEEGFLGRMSKGSGRGGLEKRAGLSAAPGSASPCSVRLTLDSSQKARPESEQDQAAIATIPST